MSYYNTPQKVGNDDDSDWRTGDSDNEDTAVANRKAAIASNLALKLGKGAVENAKLTRPVPQADYAEFADGSVGAYASSVAGATGPKAGSVGAAFAGAGLLVHHGAAGAKPFSYSNANEERYYLFLLPTTKFVLSAAAQQSNNASVDEATQSIANNPFMLNKASSSSLNQQAQQQAPPAKLSNNPFMQQQNQQQQPAVVHKTSQQWNLPQRPAAQPTSTPIAATHVSSSTPHHHSNNQYSASNPVPLGQSSFTSDPELSSTSQALSAKFPYFSTSDVSTFLRLFQDLDSENHGWIHQSDIGSVSNKAGEAATNVVDKLQKMKLVVGADGVTLEAFLA
ncbi:hypothetical protein HDU98_004412, partial [Podochytrium sp. JEL0797]